jgi:hypothetical protein
LNYILILVQSTERAESQGAGISKIGHLENKSEVETGEIANIEEQQEVL